MTDRKRRIVLVTGAARGLGRMMALNFARAGDAVGVIDISLHSFEEHQVEADAMTADTVVEEMRALGADAHGVEASVTDPEAMKAAVAEISESLGGEVTVAVANAGGGRFGPVDTVEQQASTMNLDDARARFESNFFGTVNTVQAVAPGMKRARSGNIVTMASISGLMARPDGSHADYGAVKAAIVHYTKNLAAELGPFNVNVNCVAPGLIRTPRISEKYGEGDALYTNVALRRLGEPEEIASVVEFLTSDAASYVSGHILEVTGGTRVPRWGNPPEPWWN